MSFKDKITHKLTLQIENEVWNVEVAKKYGAEIEGVKAHSHIEFKCEGGKLLSDTGYRSDFQQIEGKVHNFVKKLAEELSKKKVTILSKEVLNDSRVNESPREDNQDN